MIDFEQQHIYDKYPKMIGDGIEQEYWGLIENRCRLRTLIDNADANRPAKYRAYWEELCVCHYSTFVRIAMAVHQIEELEEIQDVRENASKHNKTLFIRERFEGVFNSLNIAYNSLMREIFLICTPGPFPDRFGYNNITTNNPFWSDLQGPFDKIQAQLDEIRNHFVHYWIDYFLLVAMEEKQSLMHHYVYKDMVKQRRWEDSEKKIDSLKDKMNDPKLSQTDKIKLIEAERFQRVDTFCADKMRDFLCLIDEVYKKLADAFETQSKTP